MTTLRELAADLRDHRTTSLELVEKCLSRIDDENSHSAFLFVDRETALHTAEAMDRLRAHSIAPSEFAGIPISVKDVFDVVGHKTTAGSRVLTDAAHSKNDSEVINRLRRAGFVVIGRTNMTEFAYSGLGINPHFGTPTNPLTPFANCIPGGSSAGAAVAVARDLAFASLATDTGGSARIPAAFCNLTGFKPTARRVSLEGVVPLSPTLDSVGWMARSVSCIAILDNVLSGRRMPITREESTLKLRIGIPRNVVMDDCEPAVLEAFEQACSLLASAGAQFSDVDLPEFDETASLLVNGGIVAAESYAWHRELINEHSESYDPRVLRRVALGARQEAADYINTLALRRSFIERINKRLQQFDAIALPTVAIRPPSFEAVSDDADYDRLNKLVLRNTMMANLFDGCAITIPAVGADGIGFMLMAATNQDAGLLFAAAWVEAVLKAAGA
jgi:aspartyl-tRNA(Asn)/glutamyl-tRNA(Gln) amidotransferase subunit A